MPLVSGLDILGPARRGGYAVPSFNVQNLETLQAALEAAEVERAPVLIQVSEGALSYSGELLPGLVLEGASRVSVPVALHLDHGSSYAVCIKALRLGFTSVMIDASHEPFAANVAETARVVEAAHAAGVSVEGELGRLGGIEEHIEVSAAEAFLTDPEEAERFVAETGVDYLAVAVGTSHGAYKGKGAAKLALDRMADIARRVPNPLVLHGASGVSAAMVRRINAAGGELEEGAAGIPDDQVRAAIERGAAKVNIDTDLRLAWFATVRETLNSRRGEIDPRKVLGPARAAMVQEARSKLEMMGASGRAGAG